MYCMSNNAYLDSQIQACHKFLQLEIIIRCEHFLSCGGGFTGVGVPSYGFENASWMNLPKGEIIYCYIGRWVERLLLWLKACRAWQFCMQGLAACLLICIKATPVCEDHECVMRNEFLVVKAYWLKSSYKNL